MIPYYDELNDEEKDAVTKVIRTLLRQTFILERKYDKKSGRLTYNKEFRTVDLHQEFLREYFKISGITLRENLHLGVFYIEGETVIDYRDATFYCIIKEISDHRTSRCVRRIKRRNKNDDLSMRECCVTRR